MSLINQMLQDLDARRASGAELALVPRYVRALPRSERSRVPWWFAAAGAAIGLAGVLTWQFAKPAAPVAAASHVVPLETAQTGRAPEPVSVAPEPSPPAAIAGPIPASAVIAREMPANAVRGPLLDPVRAAKPAPAGEGAAVAPPPSRPARAAPLAGESSTTVAEASARAQIDKRVPQPSSRELAETDFRDGTTLLHQGRLGDAQEKFRAALQHLPGHAAARQALFGLLLDARRLPEAEQVLLEGLRSNSAQPGLAMALARMQVDRGDTAGAVETLQRSAASAQGSADYIAFLAALMQRQGKHGEAVDHYQSALALAPGSSLWSMGLGISLQALQRNAEARGAYRRALAGNTLSPELNAYVDQQLRLLP